MASRSVWRLTHGMTKDGYRWSRWNSRGNLNALVFYRRFRLFVGHGEDFCSKTSLLRRIATQAEELETKRDCARLMVFDAADLAEIREDLSSGAVIKRVVPALVALHLCKVFGNTKVNNVEFSSQATFTDLWQLDQTLPPSLLAKLEELRDAAQAYDWWKECTTQFNINTASGDDNDQNPLSLSILQKSSPCPTKRRNLL
ncbi:hypothetical protein SEMRO_1524_G279620.1 [Seminavis robusta]|uniref:Uncharacterized protein n=1 Tax=Seminavis robusta TaxID=568900 RepID=A0A9N8ETB0_9STRA|nr:hypothetical protein SEMRO_1524_G279620.1 [Seminavis robusta]|eukprot:Sro1524_g279620.1 n/a (200) ;mRNA; f:13079-13678